MIRVDTLLTEKNEKGQDYKTLWHFTPKWYVINKADLSVHMEAVNKGTEANHRFIPTWGIVMWDLLQEVRQGREGQSVWTTQDAGAMKDFRLMMFIFWQK